MKLSNIFKFFGKEVAKEEIEKQPEAAITYYMMDGQGPLIDIAMNDYDKESIESLCVLLKTLSHDTCFLETVEMIKNGFIKDGQSEVAVKVLTQIGETASQKLIHSYKESIKDKPCIKPSDMLK